jgi:hypothetical protein
MDSTGDSEMQRNIQIIKNLAKPYYNVKNMLNMYPDHEDIAQVMANYIESKKSHSLQHRISKWMNNKSDFHPYMNEHYNANSQISHSTPYNLYSPDTSPQDSGTAGTSLEYLTDR